MSELGTYGLSDASIAFLAKLGTDGPARGSGAARLSSPVRVLSRVQRDSGKLAPPPSPGARVDDLPYHSGILDQLIKRAAASAFDPPLEPEQRSSMKLLVRSGREGANLPPVPGTDDRLREGAYAPGDLGREVTKVASITPMESMVTGIGTQDQARGRGVFGPSGSLLDYLGRAGLGAGIARTGGFVLKGKLPEVIERKLGIGGALLGLGLAAASHREAQRQADLADALADRARVHREDIEQGTSLERQKRDIERILGRAGERR